MCITSVLLPGSTKFLITRKIWGICFPILSELTKSYYKTSVSKTIRKPPLVKAQTALKTKKIKYGEKRFSIWRMELLHLAMWHDHDIDFTRWLHLKCGMWLWNHDSDFIKWQHPAMWYMALGWHAIEFARWQHPTIWHVALGSWHWIRQVAAPCNVADGCGMTCHRIRPNVRHIGILHLVSISTISPHSTCHSAPVCEILSKSYTLGRKNDVMSISNISDIGHLGF